MAGVRDHSELVVWQLSDQFRERVGPVVSKPALQANAWLCQQLTKAAESPCPNIAEGFSRYHPRENARFVRIAKASLSEAIGHLARAHGLGLIDDAEAAALTNLARRARGAATKYIRYLESATAPHLPRTAPRDRRQPIENRPPENRSPENRPHENRSPENQPHENRSPENQNLGEQRNPNPGTPEPRNPGT